MNGIVDIYNDFKGNPVFNNKLVGDDYLFMEYKCPVETEKFQLLSEYHFITYVITGEKDWITQDKTFNLRAGQAIFLRKGVYTIKQYFDVDHCVLTFFINDNFIKNFIMQNTAAVTNEKQDATDDIFVLDVNDTLRSLFQSMYHYLQMGASMPRSLVELKFNELLFNIILNPKHRNLMCYLNSLNQSNHAKMDLVMMKNFQHDLQLEEFARLCGKSLSTFKRDFQAYYKQTPGKWLTDKRLEFAKTLLLRSDMNVNEVCYESGFRNSSHFNKAFKEKYQFPPKQFRSMSETPGRLAISA